MLCMAMIQSHFDYACNMWYRGLNKCYKIKLQTAQNKIARFIFNEHNRFHVDASVLKNLKWLNVKCRVDYLTLCQMYSIYYHQAPEYMYFFKTVEEQHNHFTRNSLMSFVLPKVMSNGSHGFHF